MKVRTILSLVVLVAFALIIIYAYDAQHRPAVTKPRDPPPTVPSMVFTSNAQCVECHREIADEWAADEHATARVHPLLVWDKSRTECVACHAPKPVFEVGLNKMAELRDDRHEEAVGCLECHKNGGHVVGATTNPPRAPCNPSFDARLATPEQCAPCHALHGTIDGWKASSFAAKGTTCQVCHMPVVERKLAGDIVKKGRSHKFRDGNDLKLLQEAVTLSATVAGDALAVTVANTGAAHNIPAEISNREIVCLTVIRDPQGKEVKRYRESFKATDRLKRASEKGTQIPAGESRSFSYATTVDHGTATVQLRYKRQWLIQFDDESAALIAEKTVSF